MNTLRIGILDEEQGYVSRLAAYLNQMGKGSWKVSAFTGKESLKGYMRDRKLDLLAGTDRDILKKIQQQYPEVCYAWLADEKGVRVQAEQGLKIYSVYRYQSAKAVGESLRDIVEYLGLIRQTEKKYVAVYSPVGRCGKTVLARGMACGGIRGRWLYVGMEDYSSDDMDGVNEGEENEAEDFLYYVKERHKEAIERILSLMPAYIPSPFSPFDTRQINTDDMEWFLNLFSEETAYSGVVFDIGTGVMQSLDMLLLFDIIIVPYLPDKASLGKRRQFEELVKAYELEELFDKFKFINMADGEESIQRLQRLLDE